MESKPSPIKLLQLNTTVNSGSTGRIAEDIGQVMMANGHESYIAFGRGERPSKSNLIRIGGQLDVYWHGVKTALFDRHGFGSKRATQQLIKEIEQVQPDVIGMHNIHGYYLHVGVLFDYFATIDTPVVWTLHDAWSFTGHCTFYTSINCQKWRTHCQQCPKKDKYPRSFMLDNSYRNFTDKRALFTKVPNLTLVTPSQWLADEVGHSYMKEVSIRMIHNGVDIDAFSPKPNADLPGVVPKDKDIILGVASTWDERKGLQEFIKLGKKLAPNFQIVLVGLSTKQVVELPEYIVGLTRTESLEELCALYSRAMAYCNPTFQDNFPNTNIEALACGTPVFAYRTGGCPEAVDTATGQIVEVGDVAAMANAITSWGQKDRYEVRKKCRQRALDHFNKQDRYEDYLALYEEVLSAKVS